MLIPKNPWKTLTSKEVYRNDWIKVREDKVIRPDGKEGIYGVVDTRLAVGVVAMSPENEIYLVGQWRYPFNEYSWEIIEGGAEQGEDGLLTAQRELKEEAGLVARSWSVLRPEVHLSNCFSSERAVFFLAKDLSDVGASPDGTELLQTRKVKFEEACAMVEVGGITDAMSVIAILSLARSLKK